MAYTHLAMDEFVIIESYFKMNQSAAETVYCSNHSRQTIHRVYLLFKQGKSALEYYQQYKKNKSSCGRRSLVLPEEQSEYIQKKAVQGWTPDVAAGRAAFPISRSVHTIYRIFKKGLFGSSNLPVGGKRRPNEHQERHGKQTFHCSIHRREKDYSQLSNGPGHPEGDTIIGLKHRNAVITLVERLSKVIVTLKPCSRQATDIEEELNQWFESVPKNPFKSITFGCGKEFSNWKQISNVSDIVIYFVDPGTSSQRGLSENSNGLLRRDGLSKSIDFNLVDEFFIQSVVSK